VNSIEISARRLKYTIGLTNDSLLTRIARPYYNFFLSVLFWRNGLARTINGEEPFQIRPAFRNYKDDYEVHVFHYLRRTIRDGDLVMEVGAGIGFLTTLLGRWVGVAGRVFAFEPNPLARKALLDHLAMNEVADRVVVVPSAVSNSTGSALLTTNSTAGTNKLTQARTGGTVEVAVTTIDSYCEEQGIAPALIKVDIEGFEFHALRGARQTLTKYRPVVVLELHPFNWAEIGVTSGDLVEILGELKYRVVPLENQADPLREYGHIALEPD
jgi:FkbM family methyltransferase